MFSLVKNIFRNLLQCLTGEKHFQESASIFFMDEKYFQEFAPNFFMGGPHVGPPTWAQAWAQTPPPPAPPAPPDEFSDPNLTPLPTHPLYARVAYTTCNWNCN